MLTFAPEEGGRYGKLSFDHDHAFGGRGCSNNNYLINLLNFGLEERLASLYTSLEQYVYS